MSLKVFEIVTDRVIKLMKEGKTPWRRPWAAGGSRPCNIDGYDYKGINFFLLSMLGYERPIFITYNQMKKRGGKLKEGQGKLYHPVFFWKFLKITKDEKTGQPLPTPRTIPLVRYTNVYNIEQVEGIKLPKRFDALTQPTFEPIECATAICDGYKGTPKTQHGGDRAFYRPSEDVIQMPHAETFKTPQQYYSVRFHEMAHSTGHASRLSRKEVTDPIRFGSHDYSVEELTAEMTAAYLCAHCGIDNEVTTSMSAAYLANWIKNLQDDPKMLMYAAGRAQKAFMHITGIKDEVTATDEEE